MNVIRCAGLCVSEISQNTKYFPHFVFLVEYFHNIITILVFFSISFSFYLKIGSHAAQTGAELLISLSVLLGLHSVLNAWLNLIYPLLELFFFFFFKPVLVFQVPKPVGLSNYMKISVVQCSVALYKAA